MHNLLRLTVILIAATLISACDEQPATPQQAVETTGEQTAATAPRQQAAVPARATAPAAPPQSHLIVCEDVSYGLPSFAPFLQQLKQASLTKDAEFIELVLHDNIKFSFGGGYGKKAFMEEWALNSSPESSDFWLALDRMLEIGGYDNKSSDGSYQAVVFPCTFGPLPQDNWIRLRNPDITGFDYVVAVTEDAPLTDEDGTLLRKLERGETLLTPKGLHHGVATHDALTGFVSPNDVRSPIDYRMFFEQQDGHWKITLFIAGD